MGNENQDIVNKTIVSSDFATAGLLNPTQQTEFIKLVADFSVMLNMVRSETMDNTREDIDKMQIGEPITEAATENVNSTNFHKPQFNGLRLTAEKVRSQYNITWETLQKQIERNRFADSVMEISTRRIATDLELLAIRGNETLYAAQDDPFGRLLRRLDGWDLKTDYSHIVDIGGATIQKGVFSAMVRSMPQQYLNDPDLQWFVSRITATDWMDIVSDRQTAIGDQAMQGQQLAPFGLPLNIIPWIPSDLALTAYAGTSAAIVGTRAGFFKIEAGVNDLLKLDVDDAGAVELTLPAGTWETSYIAAVINAADPSLVGVARDNGFGQLVLESPSIGASSEVELLATSVAGRNAIETLGLGLIASLPITVTGTDSGSAGTVNEGSFIWLANPKNFLWGIYAGTRVHPEYNKDYDRMEVVIYNSIAAEVENVEAIVKSINVRRRQLI